MTQDGVTLHGQDKEGNSRKKLDEIRSQVGMVEGEGNGLRVIEGGDTGTDLLLLESPDHADELHLDYIQVHNSGSSNGTLHILEVTLDDDGNIDTTTRRSIDYDMAGEASRTLVYKGDSFEDHIGLHSTFQGEIGVSAYRDHKETSEPDISF